MVPTVPSMLARLRGLTNSTKSNRDISTIKKEIQPLEPNDPSWKVTFGLFSWWSTFDGRLFVICQRWTDNNGHLQYLEILERGLETLKIIPYQEWFANYKAGRLQKVSTSVIPPDPKYQIPANYRRDLRPDYNS
jgi:hypothetical protein